MHQPSVRRSAWTAGTSLLALPDGLVDRAQRQSGVLQRCQLLAAGFSDDHIRAAVRARRWQVIGRQVVVLHNAGLTQRQREWVGVLMPGKPTALAGLSAASACGLKGFADDQVHIVLDHYLRAGMPAWVRVHESRRFRAADVVTVAAPPRVRAARAIIDAAAWSRRPRRAAAIVCAAVQQRVTTVDALAVELRRAGRIRHAALLRDLLGDIAGGGHTLSEIEFGLLARRAGLSPPRRQVLRREPSGRSRYLDAEFDLPDGTILAVEIDGAGHLDPDVHADDLTRQNEVVIDGRLVLRYSSITVRTNQTYVIDQLRRVRRAHS